MSIKSLTDIHRLTSAKINMYIIMYIIMYILNGEVTKCLMDDIVEFMSLI